MTMTMIMTMVIAIRRDAAGRQSEKLCLGKGFRHDTNFIANLHVIWKIRYPLKAWEQGCEAEKNFKMTPWYIQGVFSTSPTNKVRSPVIESLGSHNSLWYVIQQGVTTPCWRVHRGVIFEFENLHKHLKSINILLENLQCDWKKVIGWKNSR